MSFLSQVVSAVSRIPSIIISHASNPKDILQIRKDRRNNRTTRRKERKDDGIYELSEYKCPSEKKMKVSQESKKAIMGDS